MKVRIAQDAVKIYNMEIKIELPSFYEEKKIIDNLNILKLVLPTMANHAKEMGFLKSLLYGSKEV